MRVTGFLFNSNWLEILFLSFSLALEEGLVEMVQAFIKRSWGATEGYGNENFYIDFQFGPVLEQI